MYAKRDGESRCKIAGLISSTAAEICVYLRSLNRFGGG
jgi:hypothetical protein